MRRLDIRETLKKPIFGTSPVPSGGGLAAKRMAVLVVGLLVVGATTVYLVQRGIARTDTWEATVTAVGRGTVNFTFEEGSGDNDVAICPAGMAVEEGDRVMIRIDEAEGNSVVRVLDE